MKKLYLSLLAVMLLSACTCKLAQDNVVAVVEEDVVVVEETPTEEVVEEEVVEEEPVVQKVYKLVKNENVA